MPAEERMDLHVHRELKADVLRLAEEAGQSLNECATVLMCRGMGIDPSTRVIPRKRPGRKAGRPGNNSRKKRPGH